VYSLYGRRLPAAASRGLRQAAVVALASSPPPALRHDHDHGRPLLVTVPQGLDALCASQFPGRRPPSRALGAGLLLHATPDGGASGGVGGADQRVGVGGDDDAAHEIGSDALRISLRVARVAFAALLPLVGGMAVVRRVARRIRTGPGLAEVAAASSFRCTGKRRGARVTDVKSVDAARCLGKALAMRHEVEVSLRDAQVEVLCEIHGRVLLVAIVVPRPKAAPSHEQASLDAGGGGGGSGSGTGVGGARNGSAPLTDREAQTANMRVLFYTRLNETQTSRQTRVQFTRDEIRQCFEVLCMEQGQRRAYLRSLRAARSDDCIRSDEERLIRRVLEPAGAYTAGLAPNPDRPAIYHVRQRDGHLRLECPREDWFDTIRRHHSEELRSGVHRRVQDVSSSVSEDTHGIS
jgi:hypothetical protein